MWLESIPESEHTKESCPTCGSGVRRRVYGEMYAGSFVLNGQRMEIRRTPPEGFIGPVVLDPLTQYFDGGLYRTWPSQRYYSRGGRLLHRDVWKAAFGEIPAGVHIHHKDGVHINNQLSNLECVPAGVHLHEELVKRHREGRCTISAKTRAAAAEWHRSEAGRLWHRRQAVQSKSWTKWKRVEKPCVFCGKRIQALVRRGKINQKYCSEICKSKDYRKRRDARRVLGCLVSDG